MKVFIVQGVHPTQPGSPITAHATRASAETRALELANIILDECLSKWSDNIDWGTEYDDANVWIVELEVQP